MAYSTTFTQRRASHLRRAIQWGTRLIVSVVGFGLFRTELLRITAQRREVNNELYIVLLAATTILTVGWIFIANKEFEIMCDFWTHLNIEYPTRRSLG